MFFEEGELLPVDPAAHPFPVLFKGTYILILHLHRGASIPIGRLGTFPFKKGYYLYVGSAFGPGGLSARLRHHLAISARPRWHLDYLRPCTTVAAIRVSRENERKEHLWAQRLSAASGLSIPVPGFGSSDCRCPAHLFHSTGKPRLTG